MVQVFDDLKKLFFFRVKFIVYDRTIFDLFYRIIITYMSYNSAFCFDSLFSFLILCFYEGTMAAVAGIEKLMHHFSRLPDYLGQVADVTIVAKNGRYVT